MNVILAYRLHLYVIEHSLPYTCSEDIPGAHMVCPSLESAMESLHSPPLNDKIESVFVLGGARAYEVIKTHDREGALQALLLTIQC